MTTAKEIVADLVARQPDDSTFDEIFRELAFARMVERGLDDSDKDRVVSDEELRRRIESWRK
jgi:hypothetical protein